MPSHKEEGGISMLEITEELTVLEELPETESVGLGGHGGHGGDGDCDIITCVVTCLLTLL
ncbi:MAG TPA: hypothetical protein VIR27_14825 [Mycobacteriales bacterium]